MGGRKSLKVWLKAGHTVEVIRRSAGQFSERTGVEVDVVTVPEATAHDALLGGESRPDVVTVPYWYLAELTSKQILQPLDRLMAEEGVDWGGYVPVAVQALSRSGQRWAVPHTLTGGVLSYRADLFDAANLNPPETLGDVVHACRVLQGRGDCAHGLVARASSEFSSLETFSGWAWGHGVRLLPNAGDPVAALIEDGVADLVEALREAASHDLTTRDYGQVGDLVAQGRAAQLFDTSAWGFCLEDPRQSRVAGRMGYATVRGQARPAQFLYAEGLGVTSWTELSREAAAFIAWRQSEECLRAEVEEVGRLDLPRRDLENFEWFRDAVQARRLDAYLSVVRESWAEAAPDHLTSRVDFVPAARRLMQVLSSVVGGEYADISQAMLHGYPADGHAR
jgi:ABC-type glycerol-3-phosphate transport system substrate-binding protein